LLEALLQPVEADDDDRALAQKLLEQRSPEDIAAALVRAHRARLPAPEELLDGDAAPAARQEGPRQGFEDTVWFRMDIGRRHKADPRWLLPLLCRRGHVTKRDIGAIRIGMDETQFEIPRAVASKFAQAVKRTSGGDPDGEGGIAIEAMQGTPGPSKHPLRAAPAGCGPKPHHKAKPWKAKAR
jgi:ATP-dependent RNA helicase DeaD